MSSQLCTDPPPTNTCTSAPDGLQTGSSSFGVGAIIAVVLGVILLVQLIACTVAWVVCLKGKQRRTKVEGIGKYKLCCSGIILETVLMYVHSKC